MFWICSALMCDYHHPPVGGTSFTLQRLCTNEQKIIHESVVVSVSAFHSTGRAVAGGSLSAHQQGRLPLVFRLGL